MKKFLIMLLAVASAISVNATVLFPFFVDIAPSYTDGTLPSFKEAGIKDLTYSCDAPGWFPKTFDQAAGFFKDTLPEDVKLEETTIGENRLFIYTSVTDNNDDTIKTSGYICKIYLLEQPDGTFHAGYFELQE